MSSTELIRAVTIILIYLLQERLQWQKNSDINMKTQLATSQENLNRKDRQIDDLNLTCKQLRDKIMQLENQIRQAICISSEKTCIVLLFKTILSISHDPTLATKVETLCHHFNQLTILKYG